MQIEYNECCLKLGYVGRAQGRRREKIWGKEILFPVYLLSDLRKIKTLIGDCKSEKSQK